MTQDPRAVQYYPDLDRLGDLHLIARTLVEGLYHGRHATPQRGGSTEFYDYRMYSPGDDPRLIDWKVFGRTERLYVRRYRRFADLTAQIIVDASASMDFAGVPEHGLPARRYTEHGLPARVKGRKAKSAYGLEAHAPTGASHGLEAHAPTKFRFAQILAASLAFLAIRQGDRAALTVVADRMREALPAGGTWIHLHHILHALEGTQPGGETRLGPCLAEAHRLLPGRRLVILLSDLLGEPAELFDALHRFRHDGCDVRVLHVLTRQELDLGGLESVHLVDPESTAAVRTFVPAIRDEYTRLLGEHLETLRTGLSARGIGYTLLTTDRSPLEALRAVVAEGALKSD